MKLNQKNRFSGRATNGNRGPKGQVIFRNTALESTGPAGKIRGTALQLVDKYQAGAKDALMQNDRVLAEAFLQYADHYMRLHNLAVANEQALRPTSKALDLEEETLEEMPEKEGEQEIKTQTEQLTDSIEQVANLESILPAVELPVARPKKRFMHRKKIEKEEIKPIIVDEEE